MQFWVGSSGLEICLKLADFGMEGDGKLLIYPVAKVIRIRTGETNEQAL
jgi:nitrogen regulatory protein PII